MRPSLEQVMGAHGKRVFAAAYSLLKNREDAEDVVQDTFLRYYTGGKQFASEEHLRAWLLRVAVNRARDLLKSASRQRSVPLEMEPTGITRDGRAVTRSPFSRPAKSFSDANDACFTCAGAQ